jgi:hypothetical protein
MHVVNDLSTGHNISVKQFNSLTSTIFIIQLNSVALSPRANYTDWATLSNLKQT